MYFENSEYSVACAVIIVMLPLKSASGSLVIFMAKTDQPIQYNCDK